MAYLGNLNMKRLKNASAYAKERRITELMVHELKNLFIIKAGKDCINERDSF